MPLDTKPLINFSGESVGLLTEDLEKVVRFTVLLSEVADCGMFHFLEVKLDTTAQRTCV